jgi:hypothetical protein
LQDNSVDVKDLFFRASKNLTESLEAARKQYARHSVSIGEAAEKAFRSFLEERLPRAFAVGEGFVFEPGGKRGLQQDIVIYDNLHHPRLISEGEQGLFPIDTVVVIVEVKANLGKQEIKDAVNKIASAKSLKRNVRNQIAGTLSEKNVIPLRGYIFAYGTQFSKTRTVAEHLADAVGEYSPELRPDFMLVHDRWWFDWVDKDRKNAKPWETPSGLRIVHTKEYGLLQFWTRLMEHLTWYRTPTPLDWIAIPDWGTTSFKADHLKFEHSSENNKKAV